MNHGNANKPLFVLLMFRRSFKTMSISINNSLPSVDLHLSNLEDSENRTRMFVYTEAAINTGNF